MCMKLKSTDWPYEQDEVTFYKVFSCNNLTGKYIESPCYEFAWRQGINDCGAGEYMIRQQVFDSLIRHGFHVFIHEEDAQRVKERIFSGNNRFIKVVGRKQDFIGIGVWSDFETIEQAVFKKLEITQEEWNKLCA